MHKTDGDGNVANLFDPGTPGVTPATQVDAPWLNAVQEELIGILSAASIAPVKGTWTQVLTALRALFVDRANAQNPIAGNKTWTGTQAFNAAVSIVADLSMGTGNNINLDTGALNMAASNLAFTSGGGASTNVPLKGSAPSNSAGFTSTLTPANITKAWVVIDLVNGSNPTIVASFNVASVTNASGRYTVNFTNATADANWCLTAFEELGVNPEFKMTLPTGITTRFTTKLIFDVLNCTTHANATEAASNGTRWNIRIEGR